MPPKKKFCKYLQGAGLDFCNITLITTLPLELHLQSMPLSVARTNHTHYIALVAYRKEWTHCTHTQLVL